VDIESVVQVALPLDDMGADKKTENERGSKGDGS
jgi:hypothetical protein